MKDPPTPLAYFPIDDYEPEIKYSVSLFFNRCLSNINLIYSMINIIMHDDVKYSDATLYHRIGLSY